MTGQISIHEARQALGAVRAKTAFQRIVVWAHMIAVLAILSPRVTAAATMELTLQPDSYFEFWMEGHLPFTVVDSEVGHTDLSGKVVVDINVSGAAFDSVQIVSADVLGTPTFIDFKNGLFPSMHLTPAHYDIVSPVQNVAPDGTFPTAGTAGVIDGGKLSTAFGFISFDFAADPLPIQFLPDTATITGDFRPGSTIELAIPVRFNDLTQSGPIPPGGQGPLVNGQGMILASGTVPVPEPSAAMVAFVLALTILAMKRTGWMCHDDKSTAAITAR